MKTEKIENVWANNVELLPPDECLPVIGSNQVSNILSHLNSTIQDDIQQNVELVILPDSQYRPTAIENPISLPAEYVILKDGTGLIQNDNLKVNTVKTSQHKKDNYENILYFVCNLCPFLCIKDNKITEHLENAHKNKLFRKLTQLKCPACPNTFYHKISLRSHLIHDHGVANSDIGLIIQAVVYYSNKKSQKGSPEENKTKVDEANNKLMNVGLVNETATLELENDVDSLDDKLISEDITIDEKDQNKLFNTITSENDNETKNIKGRTIYKCDVSLCKVKVQDLNKINYHVKSHCDNGFKCLECNEMFSYWKTLTGHLWRSHKIDMGLYSCDKCDYKTYSLAKLNNIHKFIHSDVKGFSCSECDKAFKNIKQLRNHKITHKEKSEKLLHVCEICQKYFSDNRLLKGHMDIVHKRIKPYLCNYCGYKGSTRSSLKMHIRQHTGEKPFACDTCDYTTSDHNSLRRHKLRHTGQKPYKCTFCSYACIQSSTYKVHLKTKHPGLEKDLMFTCSECQFKSVNKDIYTSHLITVHKQQPSVELN